MKRLSMLLMLVLIVGIGSAFANNDNDGKKNEGAKVELSNAQVNPVGINPINVLPEFNLNSEAVSLKTVLPACSGDTSGETVPPGYTYKRTTFDVWGYTEYYTKSCIEVVPCSFCGPPGFFTYESTDTHTVRTEMWPD